jgi:type II restriction/modification system DNA methylase subunit YeeA
MMDTAALKKFARAARRTLMEQTAARLKLVLSEGSAARRESAEAVKNLEEALERDGRERIVENVAYTWFNRFCALRFMDANGYTGIGTVSPTEGQSQPEILAEAKMGHIGEEIAGDALRRRITSLLAGSAPSRDPQQEAYRLLLVAVCNFWHRSMPFLFQRIDDYTELLMPDDLLSENSVLSSVREAMTEEACRDVEVIGWLYQFYISEKKDEVFEGLKRNVKISPENIPAATQLFTPHWIVRYLVENSLGRLWMLNRPASRLKEKMDYYIVPEEPETDFLRITSPEEIRVCDPACGSGHMLTYAFDLLWAIYEEEGYDPASIPGMILANNLYGIEIDERAGELAAFALAMKARAKYRRFFRKAVQPNICVLRNVRFDVEELQRYMEHIGQERFTQPVLETLRQFEEAETFGSLIRPALADASAALRALEPADISGQIFLAETRDKVLQVLKQADYLSGKYHVVIANPPYMGSKGMNARLSAWAKSFYEESSADLFSMFIDRNLDLIQTNGLIAMITMQGWMFLSTYKAIRNKLLQNNTILSMAHLGSRAFDSIGGEVVATTAFIIHKKKSETFKGTFLRLINGASETEKEEALLEAVRNPSCACKYSASVEDIMKIPGYPIAYWASEAIFRLFSEGKCITEFTFSRDGLTTGNNSLFIFLHWEVARERIGFSLKTPQDFWQTQKRFAPLIKGGPYRKWYGNNVYLITYDESSFKTLSNSGNKLPSREFYFRENINWTRISSSSFSFRFTPYGFIFESASLCAYSHDFSALIFALAFANSCITMPQLQIINPTTNLLSGYFDLLRLPENAVCNLERISSRTSILVTIAKADWDSYETSWDFTTLPLLASEHHQATLEETYRHLRAKWLETTLEMKRLEEENNRIFIDAYGLQDELTPDVPLNDITLTCNPHYRYGAGKSDEELEALLLADTMRELVSYAVGCIFGRYALDEPGLILANQGETLDDYLRRIPEPIFPADEKNVIPVVDGDWFADDIAERFRAFLRTAFGTEHYEENLNFVEKGLNIKNKRNYSIRDYFLGEFYADHVKRYKKRPIYWLFSSPKGSFNTLVYMHRYRPETAGIVLNDYLREFRAKLLSHKGRLEAVSISASASQGEKTKVLKEIEKLGKVITELEEYERDVLYPLAAARIQIDLDDGVKANYPKFGAALKKIPGLDAEEDE